MRVRLLYKPKPNDDTELCMVNVTDRWGERNVWYPGKSAWQAPKGVTIAESGAEYVEVSRGHSSGKPRRTESTGVPSTTRKGKTNNECRKHRQLLTKE